MFRFLGKLPTLSFPHFSFKILDMTFQSQYHCLEKRIYHAHIINQLCTLLGTSSSISFPWAGAASQESDLILSGRLRHRNPGCQTVKYSLWAQSCVGAFENGFCLCTGFCGRAVWVLFMAVRIWNTRLWAINTVSSSIQSSCICLPLVLQPHQSAAPIALWGPEELSGAESLLLTQPSCPGMLVSSSAATAWRKMKAFPLHPWVTCVHRECSLEDKSLEKSYIEYSQTRSWSLELFGYDTVLTLFLWTHPHTTIKRTDWKPLFNGWWLLLLALQISFGKSLHTKPFLSHYPSWCSPKLPCPHTLQFSTVSRAQLCDPMDCSMPGFPVHRQLLELAQPHIPWVGDAIQPFHPLFLPSLPAFNLSWHQGLFQWVSSSHQVAKYWSFSFSISSTNVCPGLISFRMDWLDLLAIQGISLAIQESSPSSQFKSINSSVLSFLYSPTLTSIHNYWKKP